MRKSRSTPLIHDSCKERRRKEIGDLARQNFTFSGRTIDKPDIISNAKKKEFYDLILEENTCPRNSLLISRGTVHQRSCAYTPGIAERKNRYLLETVRAAMMFGMNVPRLGRSCVVLTATYLINRIPSKFLLEASLITLI